MCNAIVEILQAKWACEPSTRKIFGRQSHNFKWVSKLCLIYAPPSPAKQLEPSAVYVLQGT